MADELERQIETPGKMGEFIVRYYSVRCLHSGRNPACVDVLNYYASDGARSFDGAASVAKADGWRQDELLQWRCPVCLSMAGLS